MATTPTPPLASAVNGSPTRHVAGTGSAPSVTRTSTHHGGAPRGRAGAAVWVAVSVAALVLVGLIVFMLQNTQPVLVSFLAMEGTVPLAVSLLVAAVGVGIIALVVSTVRAAQVRRRLHRRG